MFRSVTSRPTTESTDADEMVAIDLPKDHLGPSSVSQARIFLQSRFQPDKKLLSPSSTDAAGTPSVSLIALDGLSVASNADTPEITEYAEDDAAVISKPSRHVDYLSPDWNKEEDICLSWRYVTSKRKELANSHRLENASWRAWMKVRNNLKTISAEQLNWLKDCDDTWLYGPLLDGPKATNVTGIKTSFLTESKTRCSVKLTNKPILKKRAMFEAILQQSLQSASLWKQPTAASLAQESRNVPPKTDKSLTDPCDIFCPYIKEQTCCSKSTMASLQNEFVCSPPYTKRKYIHFDERVEQWIAVNVRDGGNYDFAQDCVDEDTESDHRRSKSTSCSGKTVLKLPPAALKGREGATEPRGIVMKHIESVQPCSILSPSSSKETPRPTMRSPKIFFIENDNDNSSDVSLLSKSDWRLLDQVEDDLHRLSNVSADIRRTLSGMVMLRNERGPSATDGVIGRMGATFNTVRDIAYFILNAGRRR